MASTVCNESVHMPYLIILDKAKLDSSGYFLVLSQVENGLLTEVNTDKHYKENGNKPLYHYILYPLCDLK